MHPMLDKLPAPRRPRTKIPSVEVIVRTPGGGSISIITPYDVAGAEICRILGTTLGIASTPAAAGGAG